MRYSIGIAFILFGLWFLWRAFQRRREVMARRAEIQTAAEINADLHNLAVGCGPMFVIGLSVLALGMAAIAFLLARGSAGQSMLSLFDIVGFLFFVGAYVIAMAVRNIANLNLPDRRSS